MKIVFLSSDNYKHLLGLKWIINNVKDVNINSVVLSGASKDMCDDINRKYGVSVQENIDYNDIGNYGIVDLVISYGYPKKIKKPMINLARYGCINFHPGILPQYRGKGTYYYAMMDKTVKFYGMTAHFVDEEFDTGNIIKLYKFSLDNIKTGIDLSDYMWKNVGIKLLDEIIKLFLSNPYNIKTHKQEENNSKYYSQQDINNEKEISMFDKCNDVINKVNALWYPPYEGAYVYIDGQKFYLINQEQLDEYNKFYELQNKQFFERF